MSMRCEDVRPLLAELVYEEVEPELAEQVREHLGTCLSCKRQQNAFTAVRRDLQQWQPESRPAPGGMTFIAHGRAVTPIWHSRVFQGLAAAAAVMFVAILTAAAVNLQVQSGPDGWAVSTSLGASTPLPADESPPAPRVVSLDQIPELEAWFDARLASRFDGALESRGVLTQANLPPQDFLTEGQLQQVNRRFGDMFDTRLAAHDVERDAEISYLRTFVTTALDQQAQNFSFTLASLVDSIQADHRDELFQLTNEFSFVQADNERKLQQANSRIDTLVTQVAAPERRNPER